MRRMAGRSLLAQMPWCCCGDEVGAERYRRMALAKRIKRTFTVPARPFVGDHPEVWRIAGEVAAEHANRAIDEEISKFNHK